MSKTAKTARVERRTLADGTVREYKYKPRGPRVSAEGTVAAIIALYQRSLEWDGLEPRTQTSYVTYLKPLHQALKLVAITAVQRRHLLALRDEVATTRGHGAALVFCRVVSAFFTWALERNYIAASPATKLASKLRRGELPTWRQDQALRALQPGVLPESYRRAIVLAYHTGQRRGDLCALKWSDDYDGYLWLTQEKTDEPLRIPVVAELRAELERWHADRSTITILEHNGRPWDPKYLTKQLPDQLERIGLPRQLGLHGLRKLLAVRLAERGSNPQEIGAMTGHKTLAMIQHYTKGARQATLADIAVLRLGKTQMPKKRGLSS